MHPPVLQSVVVEWDGVVGWKGRVGWDGMVAWDGGREGVLG